MNDFKAEKRFYPSRINLVFLFLWNSVILIISLYLLSIIFLQSEIKDQIIITILFLILLFISLYFFSNSISRKIIITKDEILDKWGIFRKSAKYQRNFIFNCYLKKSSLQGIPVISLFDLSLGQSTVLIIEEKNGKELGEVNVGNFRRKDLEEIITLISGKPIDKTFRTVTSYIDSAAG